MKRNFKFLLLLLFSVSWLQAGAGDIETFRDGIKKEWSQEKIQAYYKWLNSLSLSKSAVGTKRQTAIMNGNKITAEIFNYASISSASNKITDIVWNGLGYGYEFGPMVAAEVPLLDNKHPDTIVRFSGDSVTYWAHVMSEGLTSSGPELNPDYTIRWGFQPMASNEDGTADYLVPESDFIPTSDDGDSDLDGKPDSWPYSWYNENIREYVWPGALGLGSSNADKEAFFVIDDRDNAEFSYFPFPDDSTRRGLGIEVEVRIYQWSNPLSEDAMFLIYKISNKSPKDLKDVTFGMWGDPHIGGPSDYNDDWAYFDKTYNMVFAYDTDGESDIAGRIPGYLGYKFLESPGIGSEILDGVYFPGDGIDNDNDGMTDESWTDGIDNDNDWDIEKDDVGVDGVPNTGDDGEGDGSATAGVLFDITKPGEPNFEFTDIDESDMLGLTGFQNPVFGSIYPRDDEKMFTEYLNPANFDTSIVQGDRVFMYSSGRFQLRSLETKRFSIALLLGEDLNDLILNAETVQQIYNSGYQFSKPPNKPHLTVVPGDRQVTLYWDDVAESSFDPISEENDFEGYVIYRSTSSDFADQQNITDINGSAFLFEPLKSSLGVDARFDLDNDYEGPSNVPYRGRGVSYYLGNNTGLVHSYVDNNNVINGQTYFYTVVSYDHGCDSLGISPAECSKIITYDPTTNFYNFDVNTATVTPRNRVAGYIPPQIENADINNGIVPELGSTATGSFNLRIVDETAVEENNKFLISFSDTTGSMAYSVEDLKSKENTFVSFYGQYVSLPYTHINTQSLEVLDLNSDTVFEEGVDYLLDKENGSILVLDPDSVVSASMEDSKEYLARYTNYPIYSSKALSGQLTNPFFDGLELAITESKFEIRTKDTGWNTSATTNLEYIITEKDYAKANPADYLITFSNELIDTSEHISSFLYGVRSNFTIWNVSEDKPARFVIFPEVVKDTVWNPGESIFIMASDAGMDQAWLLQFLEPDSNYVAPVDGDEFYLATNKPFTPDDKFSFTTHAASANTESAKTDLDDIRVVPNPYVATNSIEPKNFVNRSSRGYRRLYFDKLPQKCTIRIYTTSGELVKSLNHDSTLNDGQEFWDLLTKDNMEVSYGLYFYHVDAPGIGQKTGKFAIIK